MQPFVAVSWTPACRFYRSPFRWKTWRPKSERLSMRLPPGRSSAADAAPQFPRRPSAPPRHRAFRRKDRAPIGLVAPSSIDCLETAPSYALGLGATAIGGARRWIAAVSMGRRGPSVWIQSIEEIPLPGIVQPSHCSIGCSLMAAIGVRVDQHGIRAHHLPEQHLIATIGERKSE